MPAPDGGDDFVEIGGPFEETRLGVVFGEEAVDRRLVSLAKNPSTAFSHEDEVGVKWNVQRGWRPSRLLKKCPVSP